MSARASSLIRTSLPDRENGRPVRAQKVVTVVAGDLNRPALAAGCEDAPRADARFRRPQQRGNHGNT